MTYIQEIKKRVELVKSAFDNNYIDGLKEHYVRLLLDYLESIDALEENNNELYKCDDCGKCEACLLRNKRRMVCEICKNPLYRRSDGSLVCVEMHH